MRAKSPNPPSAEVSGRTASKERHVAPLPARGLPADKVLPVIGDAAEVTDTLYSFYRVAEDGYEVVVGGPQRRLYHLVQQGCAPDWDMTVERPGYLLAAEVAFWDVDSGQ